MSINYLIAAWHGARMFDNYCPPPESSTYYLEQHFKALELLDHSLDQVTVIVPELASAPQEFRDYIDNLQPSLSNGTPIAIHSRANVGRSYGGWVETCHRYKDDFTHFFLMEDDYVPVVDNFDELHMEYIRKQGGGYVCHHISKDHAACSNGIVCSASMQAAYDGHQHLLRETAWEDLTKPDPICDTQRSFHKPIRDCGYKLGSIGDKYAVAYTDWRFWPKYVLLNEHSKEPPVSVPVQFIDEFLSRNDRRDPDKSNS